MVSILMMSLKLFNPYLFKVKIFLNKGYGVIIPVHVVTSKIFSRESNYVVDVVM